jgi:hypothetical protein
VSGVKGFKVIVEVTPQLSAFTRMLTEWSYKDTDKGRAIYYGAENSLQERRKTFGSAIL